MPIPGTESVARTISVSEMVHEFLMEAIHSGSMLAGEPVRQDLIADRLNVSRAPVREALNQLEREGLVVLRPRRGYSVISLDPNEIEEIFLIRMLLEEHAGRIATQRRTLQDVAAARSLLRVMDHLASDTPAGIAEWAALNWRFHGVIYRASGASRLWKIASNLRDSVEQYVRLDAATADRIPEAHKEHQRILSAFEIGDPEEVARLSREHCQHTCERLLASLRRRAGAGTTAAHLSS